MEHREYIPNSKSDLADYLAELAVSDPDGVMQMFWEIIRKALVLVIMKEVETQITSQITSIQLTGSPVKSNSLPRTKLPSRVLGEG